ncbi:MAG: TonB-dependent receptor [Bacteroidales bacterium]|nr:TonB-dependent receptor [Bacteroidales bacterium]
MNPKILHIISSSQWRKVLSLSLLLVFVAGSAWAQNVVKGVLTDVDKGEAIPFAQVYLEGTNHWAKTDLNGFYLINKIPDGDYNIKVRVLGYEDYNYAVSLKHQTVTHNIKLKSVRKALDVVKVTTSKVEERKMETQVSVEKITAAQIQQMPSIGGQADLAQYLQVLPGVNSTGDQGGQLYIRGGSMIQNLTLLDGMVVYNPFHSIGLYSIFETDIILNADVYTGGFGAEYGGRISSVMDITTRDGNKRHHTGSLGFSTFGANLILEGPLHRETADNPMTISYLISAKNSYLSKTSKVVYPYVDGGLPFDYLDLYGKLSINSGSGSKVNFFGFRFDDKVDGYQAISDFHWRNFGVGTDFALVTGSSALIDGSIAYSDYNINLDDVSADPKYSSINGFNMSLNITNFYGKNKLKAGISMEGYSTDYRFTNSYAVMRKQEEHTTSLSAYANYHYYSERWLIDPGIRFVYYASLNEPRLEPRISAKYKVNDKVRFKMAGGLYSQILLDARSDRDIVNLFSGFLTGSGRLNMPSTFQGEPVESCVQKAQHLVLGVEYDAIEHLTLNAEVYVKNFGRLVSINHNQIFDPNDPAYQEDGAFQKPQYYLTDFIIEKGISTGFDLSVCYDLERLYLWATYSLGYVQRSDEVQTYTPHYDRRHTVNVLATYALGEDREWELSARWSFGSGFPYTQTLGVYENLLFGDGIATHYWQDNGELGIYYGEIYAGRLPTYHRLDLGVKRKISFGTKNLLELSLSVTNAYNRNNLFYFNRITFDWVSQLPILVCFGAKLSF